MGVLKLGGDLYLTAESPLVDVGSEVGGENLDYDLSLERCLGCNEDAAHASATELALDFVGVGECEFESLFESAHCPGYEMDAKGIWYCARRAGAISPALSAYGTGIQIEGSLLSKRLLDRCLTMVT